MLFRSILANLQEVGIRAKLNVLERGVHLQRIRQGVAQWPGVQIIMHGARRGGSWANYYELFVMDGGHSVADRVGVKELDAKYALYQASVSPRERKAIAEEVQRSILENFYLVPIFRHAFVNAIGPRIEAKQWEDIFPTITTGYAYPWEDIRVKS